jgi:hypothetical protein
MKHFIYLMLASSLAAAQPVQIGGSIGFSSSRVGPGTYYHDPLFGLYIALFSDIIGYKWIFLNSSIEFTQKSGGIENVSPAGNSIYFSCNTISVTVGPKARFNIKSFHPFISLSPRIDLVTWTISHGENVTIENRTGYFKKIGYSLFGGLEAGNWKLKPFAQFLVEDIDFTPASSSDGTTVAIANYWNVSVGACFYFK